MLIKTTSWDGERSQSVAQYISDELQRIDIDGGGAVEDATRVGVQTAEAVGKLVEMLADTGVLTAEQVVEIADGYDPMSAEFVI